ncbi:interleukin-1 receptor-like 1 [Mastacembelus armatus]|uniref:interleukin-1 receptor-like 1 n=1 Tax=Mastacembelus armatus TaxID=205130 RepID=UPI000E460417|nr:interleukin-1 receptor-like 1 [Mastacembelus armatus]
MDVSRLLLLIFVGKSASECSVPTVQHCEDYDTEFVKLLEGEGFYFKPYDHYHSKLTDKDFTWYKNNSKTDCISSNEKERIHHSGKTLFILNIRPEDSGLYTARYKSQSGKCNRYYVNLEVWKASHKADKKVFYGEIKNSDENKLVPCPDPVKDTCDDLGGNFTWSKDFIPIQDQHNDHLWVTSATIKDVGIYTCNCTWTHNHKTQYTTGSRRLDLEDRGVYHKVQILNPSNKEQLADKGVGIKLNCKVFCGTNIKHCGARWDVNEKPFTQRQGYSQSNNTVIEEPSKNIFSTATLVIEKVSAKDFQDEFQCVGIGFYSTSTVVLRLKQRESIIPLVIRGVCVMFFCVFAAVLVKYFAIDLALLFRPYLPVSSHNKDVRMYDAYVVYQTHSMDKVTEDTLCRFITETLPSVLEKKCGYRLFIHGRDDIPGEDRLELVEVRMKQSRRLMVILTPGSGSRAEITDQCPVSPQSSVIGGFDWQVGLHHALLQREMTVILIQLGDTGPQGYTHLPLGLQHLTRKSAPIRWPEGSRSAAAWNSRFWKKVRYLMPATPAKRYSQSADISEPPGV